MAQLLSIPVVLILLGLQITVSNKFSIFNGFADLLLLWLCAWIVQSKVKHSWVWFLVGILLTVFVSGLQWSAIVAGYGFIFILGLFIKKRLWQSPLLSYYLVLIVGSLAFNYFAFYSLRFSGINLDMTEALSLIIMPSLILNLIFSFPIYLLAKDMTLWLFPYEEAE